MSRSPVGPAEPYTVEPIIVAVPTKYFSVLLGKFVRRSSRHATFARAGPTRVIQPATRLVLPVGEPLFLVGDCIPIDVELKYDTAAQQHTVRCDFLTATTRYQIMVEFVGGTAVCCAAGTAANRTPPVAITIRRLRPTHCVLTGGRRLGRAAATFPHHNRVWGARLSGNGILLLGYDPVVGWRCNTCGESFDSIAALSAHALAPPHLVFRLVRDGAFVPSVPPTGPAPGPFTAHTTPLNTKLLVAKLKTHLSRREVARRPGAGKLSMNPQW
jgi:hypothetical protein